MWLSGVMICVTESFGPLERFVLCHVDMLSPPLVPHEYAEADSGCSCADSAICSAKDLSQGERLPLRLLAFTRWQESTGTFSCVK